MSKKEIPRQTVYICNRCGCEGTKQGPGGFQFCGMHGQYDIWGVGNDGSLGGVEVEFDFCSSCKIDFDVWMASNKKGTVKVYGMYDDSLCNGGWQDFSTNDSVRKTHTAILSNIEVKDKNGL
jgi:hypothetical protein